MLYRATSECVLYFFWNFIHYAILKFNIKHKTKESFKFFGTFKFELCISSCNITNPCDTIVKIVKRDINDFEYEWLWLSVGLWVYSLYISTTRTFKHIEFVTQNKGKIFLVYFFFVKLYSFSLFVQAFLDFVCFTELIVQFSFVLLKNLRKTCVLHSEWNCMTLLFNYVTQLVWNGLFIISIFVMLLLFLMHVQINTEICRYICSMVFKELFIFKNECLWF